MAWGFAAGASEEEDRAIAGLEILGIAGAQRHCATRFPADTLRDWCSAHTMVKKKKESTQAEAGGGSSTGAGGGGGGIPNGSSASARSKAAGGEPSSTSALIICRNK